MSDPKRAEPWNEHAKRLRETAELMLLLDPANGAFPKFVEHAAAEIERLAAMERPWLPIDTAPRDGTRVELWGEGHRGWKGFYAWHNGHKWLDDHDEPVMGIRLTHWRPEPDGPK